MQCIISIHVVQVVDLRVGTARGNANFLSNIAMKCILNVETLHVQMRRMFLGAQRKSQGTKETIPIQIGGIALLNVNAKLSTGTREFGKRGIDVSFPLDTQERNTMDALCMRLKAIL